MFEIADGDVIIWSDEGTIMLKVRDQHGDAVELVEEEAQKIIEVLTELIEASKRMR